MKAARVLERGLNLLAPLVRRAPRADLPAGSAILLIEPFQMGDVLSLAPMLDPLSEACPGARIVVCCHSRAAVVFAGDPRVAEVVSAPFPWSGRASKRGTWAEWKAVLHAIGRLRRLGIDAAFDTRGDIRSQAVMLLSGCRRRVGFTTYVGSNLRLRGLLLTDALTPQAAHRLHTNLQTLAPLLGFTPALRLPALRPAAPAGSGERCIVVHPGAGWRYRRWPLARWAQLITRLQQLPGTRLLQIAGPGEHEIAAELNALLARPAEILSTDFDGLLATLAAATVFIGLDSGPMNAAALLNRPAVALFGPGIASMWRPLSTGSTYLQHVGAYPCHPCTQITCVHPDAPCIETVTVEEVFAATLAVLDEPAGSAA